MTLHVAVLFGGVSTERPVSLASGTACADALEAEGFRVTRVDVDRDIARVLTELARVNPEAVRHYEIGVKTRPTTNTTLNLVFHNSAIRDYQTQVQTPEPGVNRGYLANAEKVQVRGVEVDGNVRFSNTLSFYGSVAYTDAKYITFTNAPVPLEETGVVGLIR